MRPAAIAATAVLVLVAGLSACKRAEDKPAAVVGGEQITRAVLNWHVNQRMSQHSEGGIDVNREALGSAVLEGIITRKLLALGAAESGIAVGRDEIQHHVESTRANMGAEAFRRALESAGITEETYASIVEDTLLAMKFEHSLAPEEGITEDDVRNYFKKSPTPFLMPESFNVRFVEVKNGENASAIRAEMDAKGFEKTANSLKGKEGYTVSGYGWSFAGMYGGDIDKGLATLDAGETGGPYKGKNSFFIFHMKERQNERPMKLDEARDRIRQEILKQRREAAIFHWVANRKKSVAIIVN